jgi:hypothetical protein
MVTQALPNKWTPPESENPSSSVRIGHTPVSRSRTLKTWEFEYGGDPVLEHRADRRLKRKPGKNF